MSFSFVQITDHHLMDSEARLARGFSTAYSLRTVLRDVAQRVGDQVDFIVSTGDLVDPESEAGYRSTLHLLGCDRSAPADPPCAPGPLRVTLEGLHAMPMYFLPGNHDDRSHFFGVLFPGSPALTRMNVSFVHKGIQFICLDWGEDAKAVTADGTWEHLERSLKTGLPSVVLSHHHLVPVGAAWLDEFIVDDVERFWDIVRGKPVLGVLCGHVHITTAAVIEGVPVLTLRSTAFQFARQAEPLLTLQPPHYRLVTIHGDIMTSRIFEVPL